VTRQASRAIVLASLSLPSLAVADPVALRVPVERRAAVIAVGAPDLSAAWWLSSRFGLAVEWRLPASAVGASIGARWVLLGEPAGWGVDAIVAVGAVVPLLDPGVALSVTPSVVGRWRGEHVAVAASVVAPAVARFVPAPDLRLPILFELWFGGRLGRWMAGLHGGVGSTWVPGLSWSGAFQATVYVGRDF
jgi:hypothetical protein